MSTPILATKLYIPPPQPKSVHRPRLITRLNESLSQNQSAVHKLILISASAGFGKTTLISEWVDNCQWPVAWLSLDEGENDPNRFLIYLVVALQKVATTLGAGVLGVLQSPQPPPPEAILTALLNEIATLPNHFILVLDDYHLIDAKPVDDILAFLLDHLPPQMLLVIATREDPQLPLARLRAQGQLTELRAIDLRFTLAETAEFLNQVMGLNLTAVDIATLESRTEGWIAGLQLAALSMRGHEDTTSFIQSFTGSHRFVLDYLVEEVLHQQPENIQTFLLHTSILNRLCGSLCAAVTYTSPASGQETLVFLEQTNLFIIPLDNERRWYRYHHLFADLLRQRLQQRMEAGIAELHIHASIWYEENGLDIEAFHHAVAAQDIERAARLVEGEGMPLIFRGAATLVLNWLASLPTAVLNARPSLWVLYASAMLFMGQMADVEQKLQAAEVALQHLEPNDQVHDLIGHIAAIRATQAVAQQQAETIITQSRRALAYLHPHNLPVRTATIWTLGVAYYLQGDRVAASQAYTEAIAISQKIGHFIIHLAATVGLANTQEAENQLHLAAETYQRALQLAGEPPPPITCEAYLGLARLYYQWNDLDTAQQYGQRSARLARQIENTDRFIVSDLFLAHLKLSQGDVAGAADILTQTDAVVRQRHFVFQLPELAAIQVQILLRQGYLSEAGQLAQTHNLPLSQARVYLAQGETAAALTTLASYRQQTETKGWADERLKGMILQAVAYQAHGEINTAVSLLAEALILAEPGGFIRLFVDEGQPMAQLLSEVSSRGIAPAYTNKLLAIFSRLLTTIPPQSVLVEPLSERELEVLRLVAQGFSNREIGQRLFLALDTVKGYNRRIYDKLGVHRRTEAVARARELGLL